MTLSSALRRIGLKPSWLASGRRLLARHSWLALLLCCLPAIADKPLTLERLKVAYVFNFLKFTQWPQSKRPGSPVHLCLGNADGDLHAAFTALEGKRVQGHPIYLHRLGPKQSTTGCEVYYLRQGGIPVNLTQLRASQPDLLTIGDSESFVADGGHIGLKARAGHLQFEVNFPSLKQAQFQISAQLLQLALNARTPS
ncbi:MAG: YfiR family protein [Aeromonadaceae bacterium]|nr:YfiR family protein [Aeromonadaceae bacterium]